jgi:hypothetical protein
MLSEKVQEALNGQLDAELAARVFVMPPAQQE